MRNVPAALYKAMGGFATNGVNMTKLESYQLDGRFVATMFYADVEGHPDDPPVARALEELSFFSTELKILGAYKASPYRAEPTRQATDIKPIAWRPRRTAGRYLWTFWGHWRVFCGYPRRQAIGTRDSYSIPPAACGWEGPQHETVSFAFAAAVMLVPAQAQSQETEGWHDRLVGYNRDGTALYARVYCHSDGRCYRPRRQESPITAGRASIATCGVRAGRKAAPAATFAAPWAIEPYRGRRGEGRQQRWAGTCASTSVEKYMDLSNARHIVYTCSRSSIKEGGVANSRPDADALRNRSLALPPPAAIGSKREVKPLRVV